MFQNRTRIIEIRTISFILALISFFTSFSAGITVLASTNETPDTVCSYAEKTGEKKNNSISSGVKHNEKSKMKFQNNFKAAFETYESALNKNQSKMINNLLNISKADISLLTI